MGTTAVDQTRQTQITTRRKETLIHTQVRAVPEQEIIHWNHKIMALEELFKLVPEVVATITMILEGRFMYRNDKESKNFGEMRLMKKIKKTLIIFSITLSPSLCVAQISLSCSVNGVYMFHTTGTLEKKEGVAIVDIEQEGKYKCISISSSIPELDDVIACTKHLKLVKFIDNSNESRWDIQSTYALVKNDGKTRESNVKIVVDRGSGKLIVRNDFLIDESMATSLSVSGLCEKINKKTRKF